MRHFKHQKARWINDLGSQWAAEDAAEITLSPDNIATTIYQAKAPSWQNWFVSDVPGVVAVFPNMIQDNATLAAVKASFQNQYGQDLMSYIASFVDQASMNSINQAIAGFK